MHSGIGYVEYEVIRLGAERRTWPYARLAHPLPFDQSHTPSGKIECSRVNSDLDYMKIRGVANTFFKWRP
jgi:hypothetical protein